MRSGRPLTRPAAFTLVELLVVISIISVLIGMLLPALGAARSASHTVVCGANLSGIGKAWMNFATDNNDYIPAPGTIGQDLMTDNDATSLASSLNVGGSATQPFDWAGALAFDYIGVNRPQKRDERFAMLNGAGTGEGNIDRINGGTGVFACPANKNISVPYDGTAQPNGIDGTQFKPQLSMSYCAAREFMWWGQGGGNAPRWAQRSSEYWGGGGGLMSASGSWSQWLPGKNSAGMSSGYRPRLDRIGSVLSTKYIMADGARFLDVGITAMDHDVAGDAGYGGAFADIGAWAEDPNDAFSSKAWANGNIASTGQEIIKISMKHGIGDNDEARGNALKYDGSVETLAANGDEFRRPDHWLPSKSSILLNDVPEIFKPEYEERARAGLIPILSRVQMY